MHACTCARSRLHRVLAVIQMKTLKGEGLLCSEVVEKEEMVRGRTDRKMVRMEILTRVGSGY